MLCTVRCAVAEQCRGSQLHGTNAPCCAVLCCSVLCCAPPPCFLPSKCRLLPCQQLCCFTLSLMCSQAARNALDIGFSAVEIHGANGACDHPVLCPPESAVRAHECWKLTSWQ